MSDLNISKLPVVFLMSFGHCGIDWLHSLLDSHKQILIMPALSFYRCWKILDADKIEDVEGMYNIWKSYIVKYIGPSCSNEQKKLLHSNEEVNKFLEKFKTLLVSNGLDKKTVFFSIHQSYAYAKNLNIESKVVIVCHEHLPWAFDDIISDFKYVKILMITRDPRASIAGLWYGRVSDFGYLPDFTFNMMFDTWFQAADSIARYEKMLKDNIKIVRNEDLHDNLEFHMKKLAEWLEVEFSQTLLVQTFASGNKCLPDSRYISGPGGKYDLNNNINYHEFYSPDNVKKRWLSVLSDKRDLLMVDVILQESIVKYGYEPMNRYSFLSYCKGVLYFLLPNHALFSKWIKDYPNINDIKRISDLLKGSTKTGYFIWWRLPLPIKFIFLLIASILRRIIIYYFPGDRWKRYDHSIVSKLK